MLIDCVNGLIEYEMSQIKKQLGAYNGISHGSQPVLIKGVLEDNQMLLVIEPCMNIVQFPRARFHVQLLLPRSSLGRLGSVLPSGRARLA